MKTRLPLPFGFRWVGPWLLLTILAWLAPSTAVALTDTACLLDGGLCDASNACVRYKTGPEGELLREEVGMCEATGGNGGPLDGPQNPPLKPAEAIELTFTAYIPTALPGARRIQGDPCRGLEPWMRLRQGPFKKDDAMVQTFPILPDPFGEVIKPFGGFFFSLDRRFRSVEGSRSARMKLRLPIDLPETPGGDPLTQPSNWIAVASPTRYYEDARYYANVKGVSACVVDIAQAIPQLSNVRNALLTRANDGAKLRVVGTRVSASNPLQPTGPTIDVEVRVEVYVDPKTADTHVLVVFQHDQFPYYDSSIVVTPRNGGALDYGLTSYGAIGAGPGTCADGPTLGNLSAPAPVQSARFVITPEGALFGSNGNTRVGNPIAMGDWLMPQDTCERQAREQARQPFEKPPGRLAGS